MKRTLFALFFLGLLLAEVRAAQPGKPHRAKVLVLTERGGVHEGFVAAALEWLKAFSEKTSWK